jgi:cell division protein FtsI/penicillin-binding protein 2
VTEYAEHRLNLMLLLLSVLTAGLVARLFFVGVVEGSALEDTGIGIRSGETQLADPRRGNVRDRNAMLVAGNEVMYAIDACPAHIEDDDVEELADALAEILQQPRGQLAAILASDDYWVVLDPSVSPEQAEAVEKLEVFNVYPRLWWSRSYPHGELTARVSGFVGIGGEGFYGVEGYYDAQLQPRLVKWVGEVDPYYRAPLPFDEGQAEAPLPGADLYLTLDLAIQAVAEEELRAGMQDFGAESGIIIVMNPNTGAILALVEDPTFDPNWFTERLGENPDPFVSAAIGSDYEPGSVVKVLTVAAGIESGVITRETGYEDTREIEVGGRSIENWDGLAHGWQTMEQMLIRSLNVGSAWLSQQMGPEIFYDFMNDFGLGQLTGIDMQGEIEGQMRWPGDLEWRDSDLGANSYGQGMAITTIQLVSAVASVANGGYLMQPYVVSHQVTPDGTVIPRLPVERGRPISIETARIVSEMMVQVVEQGATRARVPGYVVAGKTGTAGIPVPGGYDPEETITTFVGFGPADDPEIIILVRLDRPQASRWASETAAVVFSRLASRLFPMLGIPPTEAP